MVTSKFYNSIKMCREKEEEKMRPKKSNNEWWDKKYHYKIKINFRE